MRPSAWARLHAASRLRRRRYNRKSEGDGRYVNQIKARCGLAAWTR